MNQVPVFKCRASKAGLLLTGTIGLSAKQEAEFQQLSERLIASHKGEAKPLTENMRTTLEDLIEKRENKELPQTLKSYCEEWLKSKLYGHEKEIKSKYLEKGKLLEDEAIRLYSQFKGGVFLLKNDERFENDYFTGEPDVDDDETIYDFKNSWDAFTFPLFETSADPDHIAQVNVYMNLTGRRKGKVVYCLQNTPDTMPYVQQFDYSGVDIGLRIKEFDVEYNESVIEELKSRVVLCRSYISGLINSL